jgi:glutamate-1-semialdehyde aminotransferase
VNLDRLRFVGIALADVGMVLAVLTFIVRLDSIARLFGIILIVAGVVTLFRWSALKVGVDQNDETRLNSANAV